MPFAILEFVMGCFAIFAGWMYYGFGGTTWHVLGVFMASLSVPAFAVCGWMVYSDWNES